jgi:hypothetical protein
MAAVLDEVGKSAEKLVDDTANANDEIDIEGEDGASEASKKKKRKKKKKKAGKFRCRISSRITIKEIYINTGTHALFNH